MRFLKAQNNHLCEQVSVHTLTELIVKAAGPTAVCQRCVCVCVWPGLGRVPVPPAHRAALALEPFKSPILISFWV